MRKINLLTISYDTNIAKTTYGDVWQRQLDYARYFNQYTVIILNSRSQWMPTKKIKNIAVIPTNSFLLPLSIIKAVMIAWRENRLDKFDLVSTQDPMATGLVGVILKKLLDIPLNIQLHTEYTLNQYWLNQRPIINRLWAPIINWQIRQADSLRVDNRAKIIKIQRKFPDLKTLFIKAPMRVDLNFFWKKPVLKKKLTKIVSVGRLSPEKNFPLLINAFKRIVQQFPNASLTIVGGGVEEPKLKRLINSLGLTKKVFLTGGLPREKVREYLWHSDIFILSSNYEGWGLVFVEAFAAGLPVITTKVASAGELVIDNQNGFVVPVANRKILHEKIKALLKNPQNALSLALAGQQRIKQQFNQRNLMATWVKGLHQTTKIKQKV